MKNYYYHAISTLVALFFSFSLYAVSKNEERLKQLRPLIKYDLEFDEYVTLDSIIKWEKPLTKELEQQKEYPLMFQIKLMAVQGLLSQGNTALAINNANLMYQKAKELNQPLGIALALRAIGETYFGSANPEAGIDTYNEALKILKKLPHSDTHISSAVSRLIIVKLQANNLVDVATDLKLLNSACKSTQGSSCGFFLPYCSAYYYIKTKDQSKALTYLKQTEDYCAKHPYKYYTAITKYLYTSYHMNSKEYELALGEYKELLEMSKYSDSYKYTQLLLARAEILVLMGNNEEACLIYDSVSTRRDSLEALSYIRQIDELQAIYKIDQREQQILERQKTILYWSTSITLIIVVLIIFYIFRIKYESTRLALSQQEQEKAKINAEKSIRTKSMFLSNMSHEIRTPLNALSGFSSILTDESIDDETRKQCNDIIQQNSELLLKLINDVIDLSSLEIGKMAFKFKNCEAVGLCKSVIDMMEKIKQTQADILFTTTLESLTLYSDNARLQQVLINLLINATKFTSKGIITLKLEQLNETEATFSVTDTGCGIPKEKQEKLFQRFEKLNEEVQGTGLGLSICQLIIEQLGGKIWVDSSYTDGARFIFTHPIHKREEGTK